MMMLMMIMIMITMMMMVILADDEDDHGDDDDDEDDDEDDDDDDYDDDDDDDDDHDVDDHDDDMMKMLFCADSDTSRPIRHGSPSMATGTCSCRETTPTASGFPLRVEQICQRFKIFISVRLLVDVVRGCVASGGAFRS